MVKSMQKSEGRVLPEIVQKLSTDLERIFSTQSRSDRQTALTSVALHYTKSDMMYGVVEAVCADDDLMNACAQSSESHPLGFDKFVLFASPLYEVRIHIWWPDAAKGRGDIHNHRFSFASAVIAGAIQVSSYRAGRPGVAMTRLAESRVESNVYEYNPVGSVEVKRITTLALSRGSAYYMDSSELHRVEVMGKGMTATLFISSGDERKNTTVITERDARKALAAKRDRLTIDEAKRRLLTFANDTARISGV
jgi:hypothetical protein